MVRPPAPAADAPVRVDGRSAWLIDLLGDRFDLLVFAPFAPTLLQDLQRTLGA